MLENYKQELESIARHLTDKEYKKMKIQSLLSLSEKLEEMTDHEIESILLEVMSMVHESSRDEHFDMKPYRKKVKLVKELVIKKFDFHERGTIQSQYVAIGICLGSGIGAAFTSVMPSMIGAFSGIGIAIGVAIGTQKEKEAEKAGKLY
ncbi:MAG: hypothetical protein JEZ08_00735 [Clostridiales bacterium]|nr:hypothetical protein [Clostridiales bacterium]